MTKLYGLALYFYAFALISPIEAKQFSIEENVFKDSFQTLRDQNFHLSQETTPEWITCADLTNARIFELCLQKEATNSAIKSANILYWQTWIGFIALFAAILAALFSAFTVRQAGKGVSVALKVGSAEVKPYIVLNIEINKNEDNILRDDRVSVYKVEYSSKNIGRSEALICDHTYILKSIPNNIEQIDDPFELTENSHKKEGEYFDNWIGESYYLYPQKDSLSALVGINNKDIEDAINKEEDFILCIVLDYKDVIGNKYRAKYAKRARFVRQESGSSPYHLIKQSSIRLQQDTLLRKAEVGFWEV